jgi:hypothetical protein
VADTFVSSRELVEQIWRRVAVERDSRVESHLGALSPLMRLNPDMERHYINAHCALDREPGDVQSAKPFVGVKRKIKRRAAHFTLAVLQRYLADEENFLAHLVRFQNNIADGHDQLAREVTTLHQSTRLEFERVWARVALLEEAVDERVDALERGGSDASMRYA